MPTPNNGLMNTLTVPVSAVIFSKLAIPRRCTSVMPFTRLGSGVCITSKVAITWLADSPELVLSDAAASPAIRSITETWLWSITKKRAMRSALAAPCLYPHQHAS